MSSKFLQYRVGIPSSERDVIMNVVFIVPTGIGAEIGGHSGDATPAAKLIASLCDKLFIHPNVVNASDINEMTENMLYVEGSILDRFLDGEIGLEETHGNRILLVVNELLPEIINAVSAARATMGAEIKVLKLDVPLVMNAYMMGEIASGIIRNLDETIRQVKQYKFDFDVLVVNTPIHTDDAMVMDYLTRDGGINLWGGIEARVSKIMSKELGRPVFHAPVEYSEVFKGFNDVVDPRKAAELVSVCYLHCCLKGAHVAPKIFEREARAYWSNLRGEHVEPKIFGRRARAWWRGDIDFLVSPINVFGRPHRACLEFGIPVIAVEENRTVLKDKMPDSFIIAKNYLEAAGVISARKAGITVSSVRRPLARTTILNNKA